MPGKAADKHTADPAMTVAHLLFGAVTEACDVTNHLGTARKTKGAEHEYNLDHAGAHMKGATDHLHRAVNALRDGYPDVGQEYDKLADQSLVDDGSGSPWP